MNSSKSPGRTPPFVLVALVLLIVILGYNYWALSNSKKVLRDINETYMKEAKVAAEKRVTVEKNLESAREELRVLQGNLDQLKKSLTDREVELNKVRDDHRKAAEETKQCKDALAKCDEALKAEKAQAEKIQAEKAQIEKDAKAKVCSAEDCIKPVKDVVGIFTKLVGTDATTKALTDGGLDANKIMEGLPRVEATAKAKPERVKELQGGPKDESKKVSSTLHAAFDSKNASENENLKFVSDKKVVLNQTIRNSENENKVTSQPEHFENVKTEKNRVTAGYDVMTTSHDAEITTPRHVTSRESNLSVKENDFQ